MVGGQFMLSRKTRILPVSTLVAAMNSRTGEARRSRAKSISCSGSLSAG
jgi:hypothetical protein